MSCLYRKTNQKPWPQTVKRQKMFGHMARFPDDAPAKLALNEFRLTKAKKFRKRSRADLALAN